MSEGPPQSPIAAPHEEHRLRATRVVGVGSSAGSLEAFTRLLASLPADTGMAFVLLSHLSPWYRSELARLLSLRTRMPVHEAVDGASVEPDHVYVLPPNRTLTIVHGSLCLAERQGHEGRPTAIDRFLQALATDLGSRAVGVVLTGTGSDGTAGLQAIKAGGGLTYAEDPALAAFQGMPRSAERSGAVDFVLPIDGIARALGRLTEPGDGTPPPEAAAGRSAAAESERFGAVPPSGSETEAAALEQIVTILQAAAGVTFHHCKRPSVARRVRHRLHELGLDRFADYLARLRQDPAEVTALLAKVLFQVTRFFGESGTFMALQSRVLPALLADAVPGRPLRTWVVGCGTGQEAYSVAISCLEVGAALGREVSARVFASDLSESGLARARTGSYSAEECTGLSARRLERYFQPTDRGYQVTRQLRELCAFARHDITRDPPFGQLDLVVFCSSVLLVLDQSLRERVLQSIDYALKPSGYLVLGAAESTSGVEGLFAPIDPKHRIYVRRSPRGPRGPGSAGRV